jgi:uncharacterized repeat protein (TIGR03837 family)
MQWDLFCRVIDNYGDIGVSWRLAADLAERGERVRLWVDDASALGWMAPHGVARVEVLAWPVGEMQTAPGDVVVEAFGCELPDAWLHRMQSAIRAPVWINLEYLSAEAFAERSHGLMSPQASGPGAGLRKWFFYPGFSERTGGLIRERDIANRQMVFSRDAWLGAYGIEAHPGERVVSLFCYEAPALPLLIDMLAKRPTLLLATAGHAVRQASALLGPGMNRGGLRAALLPALTQSDYDHLLWASDINFVRGEDSLVRALWAGRPFVWQPYRQNDGLHLTKLEALLDRIGASDDVRALWHAWNAPQQAVALPWPDEATWLRACNDSRRALLAQDDLGTRLVRFAVESR